MDVALEIVGHGPEREGQQPVAAPGRHPGVEPQQPPLDAPPASVGIEYVVEQELVGDARHRHPDGEAPEGKAGEQFVEVDDAVGLQHGDAVADEPHAAVEGGQPRRGGVEQERAQHADAAVGVVEGEARRLEFDDRRPDALEKEGGKCPHGAPSDEHLHHLVSVTPQHGGQRKGLREVATALALYGKQVTHGSSSSPATLPRRSAESTSCRRNPRPGRSATRPSRPN